MTSRNLFNWEGITKIFHSNPDAAASIPITFSVKGLELYDTFDTVSIVSPGNLPSDPEKIVTSVTHCLTSGCRYYHCKKGFITLSDKLVCSLLGWPLTLLEVLLYLLAATLACAAFPVVVGFVMICVIPILMRVIEKKFIWVPLFLCLITVPIGLFMGLYRLLQSIFRIPVGIGLLMKAGIDRCLGREEMPSLNTIQSLHNKTMEEIHGLGIDAHVIGVPAPPSIPSTLDVPERYKCCILLDVIEKPVLLSDGHFYSEQAILTFLYHDGQDDSVIRSPKKGFNLTNKNYHSIESFEREVNAFKNAILAEAKQANPNYQPILQVAQKAEKKEAEIRANILKWANDYGNLRKDFEELLTELEKFGDSPEDLRLANKTFCQNEYQIKPLHEIQAFILDQWDNSKQKYFDNVISQMLGDDKYEMLMKQALVEALAIATLLCEVVPVKIKNSADEDDSLEEREQAIDKCFTFSELMDFFLTVIDDEKNSPQIKECFIKTLQEVLMEFCDFDQQFAQLTVCDEPEDLSTAPAIFAENSLTTFSWVLQPEENISTEKLATQHRFFSSSQIG